MKIVTYNVNSIRAREERVVEWLKVTAPDVVLLQEIKLEDEKFPGLVFSGLGYQAAVFGQKTYNGVAILSKTPLTDVQRGFGDGEDDAQSRFLAATTNGVRVMTAYVPNGERPDSEKFVYKLAWLARFERYLAKCLARDEAVVVGGDYNVAPADIDCHDPRAWQDSVLFSGAEKTAFQRLVALGLVDSFRRLHPDEVAYSWWDYRMLGFPKNRGMRIDHILVAESLAPRLRAAGIERDMRKGKQPSDHAPAWVDLDT